MEALRTPEDRFGNLPDFPFLPHYVEVDAGLRMHYLDEGPRDGRLVLLLHGEPSWSFLYRHMIPPLVAAGFRCVAPDLIGFGRSDKPVDKTAYTYASHLRWLTSLIDQLELEGINLFCQDWGGLLGLRLVAADPDRFATVTASNTFLPTGQETLPEVFHQWRQFSQTVEEFPVGGVVQMGTHSELPDEVLRGYDAPFPDERYKAGARVFPALVPAGTDDPEGINNRRAWKVLEQYSKPFLTLFGDKDPITRGGDKIMQARIPGSQRQPHTLIVGGGHFIQEECGPELADHLIRFLQSV